jgi:hypothetical protein
LYSIRVEGVPRDDGTWVIEATALYRDDLTADERLALQGDVRFALLQGIVQEGLKCRRAGATIAEVVLDEGDGPHVVRPSEVGLT